MPEQSLLPFVNEEVNEVLGKTPSLFARWGNLLFLIIAVILIGLSLVVYYPSIVLGKAEIIHSGIKLLSSPGYESRVKTIFIKDGEHIKKGTIICLMEATANEGLVDTLVAPDDGVVEQQRIISPLSLLAGQTPLFSLKKDREAYQIFIQLPAYGAGKIKTGQKVFIATNNFPKEEFGELEATIISKPSEEKNGIVLLEASLPVKATTTYGRTLALASHSFGLASVVIERKTIFSKLFSF